MNNQITYNRAKTWQMMFFVMNNTATNCFMFFIGFITYYATGVAGLALMTVSTIVTAMRMFDGITDPIIGFVIDKTDGKFGKFRPMMLIGYLILSVTTFILVNTVHLVPDSIKLLYFIAIYSLYIIGYTFQTACTKGGQACLTNDPKQRPTFTLFDGIYNTLLFAVFPLFVYNTLVPKHTIVNEAGEVVLSGLNNVTFHQELQLIVVGMAGVLTILAMIGISGKDKTEYFGLGGDAVKVKFSDYWDVIKNNKAIQMLIVAASTDKLASSTMGHAAVGIVIFGIVGGSTTFLGELGAMTSIPTMAILFLGIGFARKFGQKQALVVSTWVVMILAAILAGMIWFGPMTSLSFENINLFTMALVGVYILLKASQGISSGIVIPMIADCSDYETYRSGRYVPGMMGTLFSFVDKMISSLAATIVGFAFASIGFKDSLPTFETMYSVELKAVGLFLFLGMPMLGWIASLIAMRNYELDSDKMNEIQNRIAQIKATNSENTSYFSTDDTSHDFVTEDDLLDKKDKKHGKKNA